MSNNTSYNGYTNYATWAVNLWIDNEQGTQGYWEERAAEVWENASPEYEWQSKQDAAVYELAEELKTWVEEQADELTSGSMLSDLLGWAVEQVNWREIAEMMIDTAAEDNPEESKEEEPEEE